MLQLKYGILISLQLRNEHNRCMMGTMNNLFIGRLNITSNKTSCYFLIESQDIMVQPSKLWYAPKKYKNCDILCLPPAAKVLHKLQRSFASVPPLPELYNKLFNTLVKPVSLGHKKTVLFPETLTIFHESVGRNFFFFEISFSV